jgi:chaperonin cofactor prefoldin
MATSKIGSNLKMFSVREYIDQVVKATDKVQNMHEVAIKAITGLTIAGFTGMYVHTEKLFQQVDKRFEQVDKRFEQVDKHFDKLELEIKEIKDLLITEFAKRK